jgi:hypothetical protein
MKLYKIQFFTTRNEYPVVGVFVELLSSYSCDSNITYTDCLMSLWVFIVFVLALYCLRGRVFSYKLGLAADATMIILSLPQALLTPPISPVLPKTLFCRNYFDVVPIFLLLLEST